MGVLQTRTLIGLLSTNRNDGMRWIVRADVQTAGGLLTFSKAEAEGWDFRVFWIIRTLRPTTAQNAIQALV